MRRRPDPSLQPPAELTVLPATRAEFDEWQNARREWSAVNGWPGGIVERLAVEVQTRRGLNYEGSN